MAKENRMVRLANVELRASEDKEKKNFVEGIACVFDQETDIGWFKEKIDRHAFDGCEMGDVILNFNHDDNFLLARTTNKSLELSIDDEGLHQKASIIDTTQGNDIYKQVKEGLITKMSFSFVIDKDGEEWIDDTHRTITKIKRLFDVSLVSFPAYEQTEVFARKEGMIDELAEEHRKEITMEKEKRAEEVKVEEVKEEPKTDEPKVEEPKAEEVKEEPKLDDAKEEVKEEKAKEVKEEVKEEKCRKEESEKREMAKDFTLENQVSTKEVEARNEVVEKEVRDSKENISAWRNAIMEGKEDRAGVKSTDAGVPIPSLFQSYVERAWERLDILEEYSISNIKGYLSIPYEISADGAVVHNEGGDAPNEEAIVLGSTKLTPKMIKKWISITDELEALTDDEFMKYIAEEVVYQVGKKLQDLSVNGVGSGTGSDEGVVGIENASLTESVETALDFNSVNKGLAALKSLGQNPLVQMNQATFFKNVMGLTDQQGRPIYQIATDNAGKPQYFWNGIRVKFNDAIASYDVAVATEGTTWAIVGDHNAYKMNMPMGKDVITLFDPYTLATQDKSRMIGKVFAGGNVVRPKALAKLVIPSSKKAEAKAK